MKKVIFVLAIASLAGFTSCKKDKENPVITVSNPTNHSTHTVGSHIHAMATFTDDRGLASYHIHIGDADGNHIDEWDYHETNSALSGTSHNWEAHLDVPASMPSVAFLYFEVTDAESKTTTESIMLHFEE